MKLFLIISCLFTLGVSCKKEADQPSCWYMVDNAFIISTEACNTTRAALEAQYGNQYFYIRSSEPRYCWKVTNGSSVTYRKNVTQGMVDKYYTPNGIQAQKLDCNSFCKWEYYTFRRSKITGQRGPLSASVQLFTDSVAQDTCSKLYPEKEVVIWETADSIGIGTYLHEQD